MTAHINADILHSIADGRPVQWRTVGTDPWQDYAPTISPVNPLVPNVRTIWREKPAEVEIAGVGVPIPLGADVLLDPYVTYWVAALEGARVCTGDWVEVCRYQKARILHDTPEAARRHSDALQQLNVTFFR